jgi:hypothetical protein
MSPITMMPITIEIIRGMTPKAMITYGDQVDDDNADADNNIDVNLT